ncbi:MAG: (deoxy)nucleoside triphosphate pyrophosphohydrolase [Ignavibacteriales bacterium]|nr:(deoxy)nucleoside triphosphate pyrophosphohydrolase [Ignavibacteriales bacterium]
MKEQQISVVAGLIIEDGKILVCQRKQTARYPLQWEFPGGKLESGETIAECLRRELREELGIDALIGKEFHHHAWTYPDSGTFSVHYYFVDSYAGAPVNNVFEQIRWVPIADLPAIDMLEGNREVIILLTRP